MNNRQHLLSKSRASIAFSVLVFLIMIAGCSEPMSKIFTAHNDSIHLEISDGITSVPIIVDKSYFEVSLLPEPKKKIVSGITFIIDTVSLEPSPSSASENVKTIGIWYKFQLLGYIDKIVDPKFDNYYTMYRMESRYLGLKKLSIFPTKGLPDERQDQSFILLRPRPTNKGFDTLIECTKYNSTSKPLPCEMIIQFENSVTAFVHFNRQALKDWKKIRNAVERFSASIKIDKGSI